MGMKMCLVVGIVLGLQVAQAGDRLPEPGIRLTGNLRVDFFGQNGLTPNATVQGEMATEVSRKSPWLAGGLSLLVPGAGELYAESYWKAAAFLAIEVAAWSLAYSYDKRADRQTDFYQDYANQRWNVEQYARRSLENYIPQGERYTYYNSSLWIPGTEGRPPWERVNWDILNAMEREIARTGPGQYYSHTLPHYGEQQYFELIGKYQQFYHGWDEARPELTTYQDITNYLDSNPDTQFLWYSRERGKANDDYSTASTMVTIAVVNHIVSAVDAALTANSFNKHIDAQMGMQSVPLGTRVVRVPVAKFTYTF